MPIYDYTPEPREVTFMSLDEYNAIEAQAIKDALAQIDDPAYKPRYYATAWEALFEDETELAMYLGYGGA